tara:strand:+ start:238 stop:528 length:291 start_codon:yes stop_codon:yes gene_type:complete
MTTTWTITQLDRQISNGFVTTAHWTASAVDGDYSASTYATSSWADGTPTTPYADLTQATVLDWIWANGVDKEAVEASLQSQIDAQKNPVSATGVPW